MLQDCPKEEVYTTHSDNSETISLPFKATTKELFRKDFSQELKYFFFVTNAVFSWELITHLAELVFWVSKKYLDFFNVTNSVIFYITINITLLLNVCFY